MYEAKSCHLKIFTESVFRVSTSISQDTCAWNLYALQNHCENVCLHCFITSEMQWTKINKINNQIIIDIRCNQSQHLKVVLSHGLSKITEICKIVKSSKFCFKILLGIQAERMFYCTQKKFKSSPELKKFFI